MNTTPENTTPKKPRALPRQWKRFIHLEIGDHFFIGRCRYIKRGFFSALAPAIPTARRITVPPWRKVQTDVLVRDALPGGKSSLPVPAWDGRVAISMNEDPGVSGHYVGDDRPGRTPRITETDATCCHAEIACGCPVGDPGAIGETGQPHSDNNITGPTS